MTLQEALASASDHGRSSLAKDIVACRTAWDWLKENVVTEKIKQGDFFLVSLEDFPAFCQEALTHSVTILPHRDGQRYGNLSLELIVAAESLKGGDLSAESIASLLLSYCGESEPGKYIQSLSLLICQEKDAFFKR